MYYSKYTFHTPLLSNNGIIIGNYLTGSMDILDKEESELFLKHHDLENWDNYSELSQMIDRGYLYHTQSDEEAIVEKKKQSFKNEYSNTPVQIIFTPTYVCNLGCNYCYQVEYENTNSVLKPEVVDAFFVYINKKFKFEKVKPYITLFGGEPLLGGNEYKTNLLYFMKQATKFGYEMAIVTNGYELINYLPHFIENKFSIKEIQLTLDGSEQVHDKRRPTKKKEGTFKYVSNAIDQALKNGFRVNLRSIVDKNNMNELYKLAEYTEQMGWLNYPSSHFQTTLGRNYELHFCQVDTPLYERSEMWSDFVIEAEKHPVLYRYYNPQFHGIRTLSETGQLPEPIFDACPAGKKEWAFDYKGDIYGCTASVGVEKYRLGNFINGEIINEEQLKDWKKRDVFNIPECSQCAVSLTCGGGCGVLAANHTGNVLSPDCRPVKELVALGLKHYNVQTKELINNGASI
ncbi:MAG: SPASM domain-containing protein [Spirochaetia bacterium]|nr:SPASM domain-containing protein [Spirochaetia bacterium]